MRSTKSKSEFFNAMKKKPALQKILDNIDTMTWQEIDAVRQPKWIKDILHRLKFSANHLTPEQIAGLMADQTLELAPHSYATYKYIGETRIISQIEVFNNELLLVIDNDTIKVSHVEIDKSTVPDSELQFVENIKSIGAFVDKKLDDDWDRLCPGEAREVDAMGRTIGGVPVQFRKIE